MCYDMAVWMLHNNDNICIYFSHVSSVFFHIGNISAQLVVESNLRKAATLWHISNAFFILHRWVIRAPRTEEDTSKYIFLPY